MKSKILICFCVSIILSFVVANATSSNTLDKNTVILRVAGDNNHPPYEYIDESGVYKGFNVDIMNALSIELGIDIEIVPMEWSNALKALERKEVDLIQGLSKTKDREEKFIFASPTVVNSQAIFVLKETSIITEIGDLSGTRVALQEGDINHEVIGKIQNVIIVPKRNQNQAMDALLNGEVDAFVGNRLTGTYYLQKLRKSHLVKIVGEPMELVEYGPATYLGNEELIIMLNKGLANLKKNGIYDKIYRKWFGEEIFNKKEVIRAYIKEFAIITGIVLLVIILFIVWNKRLKTEVSKRTNELQAANKDLLLHQQKIHSLAYYDSVTSLPNRLFLIEALNKTLNKAIEDNSRFAILYFDLDRFKQINDTLGHDIGDIVLDLVGKRIAQTIRKSDILARIGGDEFIVLMPDINNEKETVVLAERIIEGFSKPFAINTYDLYLTTSIGIAIYPEAGDTSQAIMKSGDIAMYKAKDNGGNGYFIYTKELSEKEMDNLILINQLRQAEQNNELRLFYQPIIEINTGNIVGTEALIRWEKPGEGLISPARFIPLAEETGLIVSIGEWVLRTACKQHIDWINKGYKPITVSVNISARQFQQHNFVETILKIINETKIDPSYLVLEITESTAIMNIEYTLEMLKKLKGLGVQTSIDDFGTGYSSLHKLKEMNVDELKIDKSFIQDLNLDTRNEKIAKTIIILANELKLKVIAEGVETKEQQEFLKENGCINAQGYYYSKPLPADELEKLFA
ncbi:putative signaling protein PA1727 [Proteiniborus sp. DW1]|uniref:EAL domain-containing protein n=1 Tax=Proteiniborus sp. DW1 TaxID=1889883 RepID=UPI00092DF957|nr:EAL domain-containing protein [Proteiniborus sp. DW1]SCG84265.1 putative signaling protein PA1727 [Proteiniborus sp. DW1]